MQLFLNLVLKCNLNNRQLISLEDFISQYG